MARHNNLRDGVDDLAGKAFTPHTCVTTPKVSQVAPCGGEGKSQSQSQRGTTSGRVGGEGEPTDMGPMDAGGGQYSRAACREN